MTEAIHRTMDGNLGVSETMDETWLSMTAGVFVMSIWSAPIGHSEPVEQVPEVADEEPLFSLLRTEKKEVFVGCVGVCIARHKTETSKMKGRLDR